MKGIDLSHLQSPKEAIAAKQNIPSSDSIWNQDIRLGPIMSLKDKQNFFHLLHVLLSSGLGIMDAFSLITKQSRKKNLGEVFECMQKDLLSGVPLSQAMESRKKVFSPFEIHSVAMGEQSGKMDEILSSLASYYEKRISLKRKITQALSYPVSVVVISMGVLSFMVLFVVPMFEDIFSRFDAELPPITQAILSISQNLTENIRAIVFSFVFIFVLIFYVRKREFFRKFFSRFILTLPFLGSLLSKLYLSRLAYSLSMMLSARVNLDKTLTLLKETTHFYPYQKALVQIREDVINGKSLFDGFSAHSVFPDHFCQIIRVGEKSAKLDQVIKQMAKSLEEESEAGISQLTQFLEPLLIIVLGVLVAIILIAMYLPMFELSNAIS